MTLKSMHPSARKATALSSLPPLMIPLPPALPTNHHSSVPRRRKPFCGSSALSTSSTTVLRREAGAVAAGHRPATPYADKVEKEERRDSVRPRKRKGDVLATDGLNSWPRN